jgi:acetyl-CoA C-acetyltransferase
MLQVQGRVNGRPARGLISICAAGGQGVVAILEAA